LILARRRPTSTLSSATTSMESYGLRRGWIDDEGSEFPQEPVLAARAMVQELGREATLELAEGYAADPGREDVVERHALLRVETAGCRRLLQWVPVVGRSLR
jgi:hypothetical protein